MNMIGMEIRLSVTHFVVDKIKAMRNQNLNTKLYQNIGCLRTNSMKYLPNFFCKGQLFKLFFCFPDPHFKAKKHKARIINSTLVAEYAYALRPGGIAYTITDVEDLHLWMTEHFEVCSLFEQMSEAEVEADECATIMQTKTEEGQKVERNQGKKYVACFRRVEDPPWPEES
jgi:tRNA (guanine-N7-)-methyltransferase